MLINEKFKFWPILSIAHCARKSNHLSIRISTIYKHAKLLGFSNTVIGKYERDEMTPSVEVVKNLAKELDTTIGYLPSEPDQVNILKDPDMLKRLNDIATLSEEDKSHILYTIDNLLA